MNSSALKGLYLTLSACCVWMCVLVSAHAESEPLPSPLYRQSLDESVVRMDRIDYRPADPLLILESRETVDTVLACVYELISFRGSALEVYGLGLWIGSKRRGPLCNTAIECDSLLITGNDSLCISWRLYSCELTTVDTIPSLSIECLVAPTMGSEPTCNPEYTCGYSATCKPGMSTCEGNFSCPGAPRTGVCPGPTCYVYGTCGNGTCPPNATCLPGGTCPANSQTCSGGTCGSAATCSYNQTCPPRPTCAGVATCDQTCSGLATCDAQPGCTLCSCPKQGDLNGNGTHDIADLLGIIGRVFFDDRPARQDSNCPHSDRADLSCDGEHTILDIVLWVDYVWRKMPNAICDPCTQTGSR